jgi:hypothetical protein
LIERHINELAELIDALYDGSASVEESGEMLTRCHQILDCYRKPSPDRHVEMVFMPGYSYTCNGSPHGCEGERFGGCAHHQTGKFQ